MKRLIGIAAIAALGVCVAMARAADARKPDATLRLSGGAVAAGAGITWGRGTLSYKGKEYPVHVRGLTVGDVGVSRIEAAGNVYNLAKLADFDGNYTTAAFGAALAGGASAAVMKNQNGVTVELLSTTQGVRFELARAGVEMKIDH